MSLIDFVKDSVASQYRMQGRIVDQALLDAVLIGVDVGAERGVIATRVTWEPWDWVSPINGVSAEEMQRRPDVVPGQAYTVSIDGVVVVFQPHLPGASGLVPIESEESMRAVAEAQVSELVDSLTLQQLTQLATTRLARVESTAQRTAAIEQQRRGVE